MKVIHVIAGLNDGGAEAVLYRLCVQDKSHTHVVISLMDEGKYGPLLEKIGITVICLSMPRGKVTLSGLIKLWQLLRQIKPDALQTWMFHADLIGGVIGRLAGIKNITWGIHSSNLEPNKTKRSTILVASVCAKLSRWVPRNIIYCAARSREVYERLGYCPKKGKIIPNGYNISEFRPDRNLVDEVVVELGLNTAIPIIGMVARFDPQKDHKNLICALGILKKRGTNFTCLLIGSGLDKKNERLLGWIKENNASKEVYLLGKRNDVPAIMNVIDLHVLSSSFGEAFPNVICEAMASGTPCVATDVGDSKVIIASTGWVAPPNNAALLAECIALALDEKETEEAAWNNRRNASRKRIVDNFSIETMVNSYQGVWSACGSSV